MIGICAVIKNEHLSLKEWLDYHFSIGIDHVWLFEDYTSDSHADIVKGYGDKVTLLPFSITGAVEGNLLRQCAVYEWFCHEYEGKMDWCAFIDVDEFIVIENGMTLAELCDKFKDSSFNGFGLYWKMYNANGHIKRPEGNVRDNYTQTTDYHVKNAVVRWVYKTIVNMHKHIERWPVCHSPGNVCDIEGNRIDIRAMKNTFITEGAYLAHYFTKSWEDWLLRIKRGNIMAKNRNISMFFSMNPDMAHLKENLLRDVDYHETPAVPTTRPIYPPSAEVNRTDLYRKNIRRRFR